MYLLVLSGTFLSVFLKGLQTKNVVHNMYLHMGAVSYLMGVLEVLLVGSYAVIIIDGNWWYAFVSGTASALGIMSATWVHNRFFKRTEIAG